MWGSIHILLYAICCVKCPFPLPWAERDYCGSLALLALNSVKNLLQIPNMLSLHAAAVFVTEFVGFAPGGSGSLGCYIVFGNHNARTKITCLNKSGILRCPTIGLLCIEIWGLGSVICGGRIHWCLLWGIVLPFNVRVCEMFLSPTSI